MHEEAYDKNDLYEHYHFTADKGQGLLRIDKFLLNKLESISRNKIQEAANAGCILVNNIPVKPSYKVKPLDEISIVMTYPPREIEIIPENIPIDIIYEDESIIIVNKKAGMVVHPAYGNYTGTLINALAYYFRDKKYFNTGDERPGLVHRIDKNTSGLLIVAKNEEAKNKLALQFYKRTTKRKYISLVWGAPKEEEGTITGNIGRNPKNRKLMHVFSENDFGKHAITHYKVLEHLGYVSLLECRLETGRTHQIRVHFKYQGLPLFNDPEYGGNEIIRGTTFTKYKQFVQNCFKIIPGQALHAKTLGFIHPETNKEMGFDSELPADMIKLIEKWRNYIVNREF
ncbi:RluA family pseudouridine synthase [Bacteroidota bacterium]